MGGSIQPQRELDLRRRPTARPPKHFHVSGCSSSNIRGDGVALPGGASQNALQGRRLGFLLPPAQDVGREMRIRRIDRRAVIAAHPDPVRHCSPFLRGHLLVISRAARRGRTDMCSRPEAHAPLVIGGGPLRRNTTARKAAKPSGALSDLAPDTINEIVAVVCHLPSPVLGSAHSERCGRVCPIATQCGQDPGAKFTASSPSAPGVSHDDRRGRVVRLSASTFLRWLLDATRTRSGRQSRRSGMELPLTQRARQAAHAA